jgi:hypothetical protein
MQAPRSLRDDVACFRLNHRPELGHACACSLCLRCGAVSLQVSSAAVRGSRDDVARWIGEARKIGPTFAREMLAKVIWIGYPAAVRS